MFDQQNECLDILRKTQKNIRDTDVEVFLHLNPEVAVSMVNDLIDDPQINMMSHSGNAGGMGGPGGPGANNANSSMSNAIDKETKNFA